jgi:hypothetical protein
MFFTVMARHFCYRIGQNTPEGTTGEIVLPCFSPGHFPFITIDGHTVPASMKPQLVGNGIAMNAQGGSHKIVV